MKQIFGFTLIELLVVMAILAILSTLGINSFMSSQMKARDAQRKSDLTQISKALELYYNDNEQYPATLPNGAVWQNGATMYIKQVPVDPRFDNYFYEPLVTNGVRNGYYLFARLENINDPSYIAAGFGGRHCPSTSTVLCNYYVSSTNAPNL